MMEMAWMMMKVVVVGMIIRRAGGICYFERALLYLETNTESYNDNAARPRRHTEPTVV